VECLPQQIIGDDSFQLGMIGFIWLGMNLPEQKQIVWS